MSRHKPDPRQQDLSSPTYAFLDALIACERQVRKAVLDLRDASDEPDDRAYLAIVGRAQEASGLHAKYRADLARRPLQLGLGCELRVRS